MRVGVVEDAYWLLRDRIAMRLFQPLGPCVRRWTVGRSIGAVLLATQDLGLLFRDERPARDHLPLLCLLHAGHIVLLLL